MGIMTGIGWCDSTVNPTTGCDGCELHVRGLGGPCYAGPLHEGRLAKSLPELYAKVFTEVRLAPGRMARAAAWPDLTGKSRPDKPWLNGLPRLIFVGDMGDILSGEVPFEYLRDEILASALSRAGQRHIQMWLTKRPSRLRSFAGFAGGLPANVWVGTSLTNRASLKRLEALRGVPAETRFLSIEPLWEDLGTLDLSGIALVIVGGESGPRNDVHSCDLAWIRNLRDQCRAAGVAFFFKQWGSRPLDAGEPLRLRHPKGENWDEFPGDVRLREMPSRATGGKG